MACEMIDFISGGKSVDHSILYNNEDYSLFWMKTRIVLIVK